MSKCSYCKKYHDPKVGTHKCSIEKEVKIKTTTITETWDGEKYGGGQEEVDMGIPGEPIDQKCKDFERMDKRWKAPCNQCDHCQDDECKQGLEAKLEDERWDEPIYLAKPQAVDGNCWKFKQKPIEEPELPEGEKADGKAGDPA